MEDQPIQEIQETTEQEAPVQVLIGDEGKISEDRSVYTIQPEKEGFTLVYKKKATDIDGREVWLPGHEEQVRLEDVVRTIAECQSQIVLAQEKIAELTKLKDVILSQSV